MIRGAVLGGDVSKSRSPAIHGAAFRALDLPGSYGAFSVDAAGFPGLVRRLAAEGHDYFNVTIPHKRAAARLADSLSPVARAMAAANTLIVRRRGQRLTIRGENTDGYGLLAALADLGAPVRRGQRFVMLGSGGAAAGALAALIRADAEVILVARRPTVASAIRRRFSPTQRSRISVATWSPAGLGRSLAEAHGLVSAVPASAFAEAAAAAGLEKLPRRAVVVEMAYGTQSPLSRLVRDLGARYQDGLPMLVHQAARAVELVTGRLPPAGPLLRAARAARPGIARR